MRSPNACPITNKFMPDKKLPPQQLKIYLAVKKDPLITYAELQKLSGGITKGGIRSAILALARKGYVAAMKEQAWIVLK